MTDKIRIWCDLFNPVNMAGVGGPNTFASNFIRYAELTGNFEIDPDYPDIYMATADLPANPPPGTKKVVHRLDGTYMRDTPDAKTVQSRIRANFDMSDGVIYQSGFSKKLADRYIRPTGKKRHAIIYNGVDTRLYYPTSLVCNEHPVIGLHGNIRHIEQLSGAVKTWRILVNRNPSFARSQLRIMGDIRLPLTGTPLRLGNLRLDWPGLHIVPASKEPDRIRSFLTSLDVYLHTRSADPCPNAVLEAMACGVPVATWHGSGGAIELVLGGTRPSAVPDLPDGSYTEEPDPKELATEVSVLYESGPVRYDMTNLTLTRMGDRYHEFMGRLLHG